MGPDERDLDEESDAQQQRCEPEQQQRGGHAIHYVFHARTGHLRARRAPALRPVAIPLASPASATPAPRIGAVRRASSGRDAHTARPGARAARRRRGGTRTPRTRRWSVQLPHPTRRGSRAAGGRAKRRWPRARGRRRRWPRARGRRRRPATQAGPRDTRGTPPAASHGAVRCADAWRAPLRPYRRRRSGSAARRPVAGAYARGAGRSVPSRATPACTTRSADRARHLPRSRRWRPFRSTPELTSRWPRILGGARRAESRLPM